MKNTYRRLFLIIPLLIIITTELFSQVKKNYLSGQIISDPEHPGKLVYNRDTNEDGSLDPFYMCGPGGPEGFLYNDISGGYTRETILDSMSKNGGNCIYMQGIRSHGGDGDKTQNPFLHHDPQFGIDHRFLAQWEKWFYRMEKQGIVIYFFFFDDGVKIGPKNKISLKEREYITSIVNAFEHHSNLIWVVAEEYQDSFTKEKVSRLAKLIRMTDNHNHIMASHQLPGLKFHHAEDSIIDQFAMQLRSTEGPSSDIHEKCLKALQNANHRYHVNLAEQYDWHSDLLEAGNRKGVRKVNWAAAITGMPVMHLGTWETTRERRPPSKGMLHDYRNVYEFMESIHDLNAMEPMDQLIVSGKAWVLGRKNHYIVYLPEGGSISINLPDKEKTLHSRWYNPRTGSFSSQKTIQGNRKQTFQAVNEKDWVLHIQE